MHKHILPIMGYKYKNKKIMFCSYCEHKIKNRCEEFYTSANGWCYLVIDGDIDNATSI